MRITYTLCLIFLTQIVQSQVTIEKEPAWIVQETYNANAETTKNNINGGAQILLYTEQVNVALEEVYYKSVGKAVEYSGIQNISDVSADYDPSYQKLRFHRVDVVRDGKTIHKLRMEDIQTARREKNSENFIYDGTITAFMNIPDVRMGDITIFSYSIKGFNPIQKEKFATSFFLNSTSYIDKVSTHIFSPRKLWVQALNSTISPVEKIQNGIIQYSWSKEEVPAITIDENVPPWHIQNETVFISEYESWKEVINWGDALFRFDGPNGDELQAIAKRIENSNPTEGERISAALKFVQNEVRYLALNSGIGGYQPNSPDKVVSQRFGDCKDKSVLLVALLHEMEIEAYPTLVNTGLGPILTNIIPTSKLFDHCIVKVVDKKGTNLWYDPTLISQGGTFDKVFIPDYQFGLVLDGRLNHLDTIPNFQNNMVETFTKLKVNNIGESVDLQIESHYYDGEADYMRAILNNNSQEIIDKELVSIAIQNYGRSTSKAPFTFVDDSLKNEIVLYEQYRLDSIWKKSAENKDFSNLMIVPFSITSSLSMPTQLERSTPYAMSYPMVRRHNFEVQLPERINTRPESFTINSDYFYYDYNSTFDTSTNTLNLSYYYKNQNNHVPASKFNTFYDEMVRLDNNIGYLISVNRNHGWISKKAGFGFNSTFIYGLVVIVVIAILIIGIIILVKLTNRNKID